MAVRKTTTISESVEATREIQPYGGIYTSPSIDVRIEFTTGDRAMALAEFEEVADRIRTQIRETK